MGLDNDFWSARMAYLAKLAHADGLAVVLEIRDEGFATYVSENLPSDAPWNGPALRPLLREAVDARRSTGSRAVLPLADGRATSAIDVAPIVWNDQPVGVLVALRADGAFDERESADIARVAELVGLELAEANQLRRAQLQQSDLDTRLRAATRIGELARKTRDPGQLLEKATTQLAELFGADGVSIMLADDAGQLSVRSSMGLSDAAKQDRKKVGEGISGYVAQTGRPLLLTGQVRDQRFTGNDASTTESIVAPLRSDQKTIGVINIKHRSDDKERYGQAQVDSLTQVASEIADAFVAAEALQRVEEDRRQAIVLYELSRLATLGNDPATDLDTAAAMLGDTLGHDVVGVWASDPGGGLRLRAAHGYGAMLPDHVAAGGLGAAMTTVLSHDRVERARHPEGDPSRPEWAPLRATEFLVAPIGSHGNIYGALVLGRRAGGYAQADADFAGTLGEYLSGSIQKTTAGDPPEVITANERKRIAQELHDGIAKELTGVVLALDGCQRALERDPASLAPSLAKAARDARATLAEVRQYMAGLRQSDGALQTLPVAVTRLVDELRRQTGLRVELEQLGIERELVPAAGRAVMRVVGESLRNVGEHARATNAKVTLSYAEGEIVVTIEDDGIGFTLDGPEPAPSPTGRFGLAGMRERTEAVGGTLVVLSEPGHGTVVKATVPYEPAEPDGGLPEPAGLIEDVDQPAERSGIISKLLRR